MSLRAFLLIDSERVVRGPIPCARFERINKRKLQLVDSRTVVRRDFAPPASPARSPPLPEASSDARCELIADGKERLDCFGGLLFTAFERHLEIAFLSTSNAPSRRSVGR